MRYRVSLHPYSIEGFGRIRTVPTNVPGGLGYTYPNPIQLRDKLWLFWRGGGWNPTFSYTEDGYEWVPARELVYTGGGARPYAKYVGDGNRRIHAIFSNGNAHSTNSGLHYLRYEGEELFAVGGRRLGTLRDVPLHISKLDHIYRYSAQSGSAWPHDIALTSEGRPRIVYTRLRGGQDTFYYAYHNGTPVGQPQDRRRRTRPRALRLGRGDARPRGPALRLPVANDRHMEPGRAVVHARRRPDLDDATAHREARRVLRAAGHAARPARRQPRPLLDRRRTHDRLDEVRHADSRAGLLATCPG